MITIRLNILLCINFIASVSTLSQKDASGSQNYLNKKTNLILKYSLALGMQTKCITLKL